MLSDFYRVVSGFQVIAVFEMLLFITVFLVLFVFLLLSGFFPPIAKSLTPYEINDDIADKTDEARHYSRLNIGNKAESKGTQNGIEKVVLHLSRIHRRVQKSQGVRPTGREPLTLFVPAEINPCG